MGPLWIDLAGYELDGEEKDMLAHPSVGGVILFSRNFHDSDQLIALNQSIRIAAKRPMIIGADQEGGRVQRFKETFSLIPPASSYREINGGEAMAEKAGWLMAAEIIAHGIDLSFAPVLDRGFDCSAITTRAFGETNAEVIHYSTAFMKGMKQAGMATTGKHFPGHGAVLSDSHYESPVDERQDLFEQDMAIFKAQIQQNILDAMMPAHVIYPHYDEAPASGSSYWLKDVLRQQLGFKGIVFSDDLNMKGAHVMGSPSERAQQSLDAGCDMLLLCNDRTASIEVLDSLAITQVPEAKRLLMQSAHSWKSLQSDPFWKQTKQDVKIFHDMLMDSKA